MKANRFLLTTFSGLLFFSVNVNAFTYYITFTGSGANTTVDSVIVQNLSKGTWVKVPAGMALQLSDVNNAVDEISETSCMASVYPNPVTDKSIFSFLATNNGNTRIAVYSADGRKLTSLDLGLLQGKHSFQLSLPKSVFIVEAKGNDYFYTVRTISFSTTNYRPTISLIGNTSRGKPQKVSNPVIPEAKLQYSTGDQILYKGYSGNYCTIVTDKPTSTKTTDFKFVDCTDTDGNHYAVVHIGTQTWMAENLKTTKFRNAEAIGTTTPATKDIELETVPIYQWAYDGDENNATRYGRLYTCYTVADARNIAPVGWHVATDGEWSSLEDYLIANGYNYDGTTTDNKIAKALAATIVWIGSTNSGTIGNDFTKNNSTGFTALPGGSRIPIGSFLYIGDYGNWWSSTVYSTNNAWFRYLNYDYDNLYRHYYLTKSFGFSVRCVKD